MVRNSSGQSTLSPMACRCRPGPIVIKVYRASFSPWAGYMWPQSTPIDALPYLLPHSLRHIDNRKVFSFFTLHHITTSILLILTPAMFLGLIFITDFITLAILTSQTVCCSASAILTSQTVCCSASAILTSQTFCCSAPDTHMLHTSTLTHGRDFCWAGSSGSTKSEYPDSTWCEFSS